jgi:hypothetical protein
LTTSILDEADTAPPPSFFISQKTCKVAPYAVSGAGIPSQNAAEDGGLNLSIHFRNGARINADVR